MLINQTHWEMDDVEGWIFADNLWKIFTIKV